MPSRRVILAHDRDLEAVPLEPRDEAVVEVLDLNRNPRLGRLPPLGDFARLRFLYAEETGIAEAPPIPPSLEYLNLAHNRIQRLPQDPLPRLLELRAQGNPLEPLRPDTFAAMPALRLLSLRGCGLQRLPDGLEGLRELRDLDLRANGLTEVPEAVAALPSLQRVDLRWNPMDAVPPPLERLAARGGVLWHPAR